ncbi:tumor necrosis factor receptor superfamily member 1A [Pseudorasbora parva]|uniref:tumor necrosis factor receptor superfamily member 1A n=1 Tax=Pseudorasbora parva TaxID=51549 RepID=UPI00351F481D
MLERCTQGSDTLCRTCGDGFFVDHYNENYRWCPDCKTCTKEYMKYEKHCTPKSNAVCTCEEGYKCSDSNCEMCVKVQTTTSPTTTLSTKTAPHSQDMKYEKNCTPKSNAVCTCEEGYRCSDSNCKVCVQVQTTTTPPPPARPASTKTPPHTQNNVWISVSLCFACVCVCVLFTCFLLISRHARPCGWIMSTSTGFWSSKKSYSGSSQCTQEEEVPMPVQEVCGKTEKLEDV